MQKFLKSLARDESGVTAVEYAILAGIVVAALAGLGTGFGKALTDAFTALATSLGPKA